MNQLQILKLDLCHWTDSRNYESHVLVVVEFAQYRGDRMSHHDSVQQEPVMIELIASHFGLSRCHNWHKKDITSTIPYFQTREYVLHCIACHNNRLNEKLKHKKSFAELANLLSHLVITFSEVSEIPHVLHILISQSCYNNSIHQSNRQQEGHHMWNVKVC